MFITVTQLNNFIKGVLDTERLIAGVSVRGEVANCRTHYENFYFTLKDQQSQIDCFCRGDCACEGLSDGKTVIAQGNITFYTKNGKLSFYVSKMTPERQLGEDFLRLEALKTKLDAEGLFAQKNKMPVRRNNTRIGVVSSESGAVIHDIEKIIRRRNPMVDVLLYPSGVQGAEAAWQLARGVRYFSMVADVDVVIIARGGGSNEDLSAFNSEEVVRAVAECRVPIVAAIGHGINLTLCDFAADLAVATPSEAAELCTLDAEELKRNIIGAVRQIGNSCAVRLRQIETELKHNSRILYASAEKKIAAKQYRLMLLAGRLKTSAGTKFMSAARMHQTLLKRLDNANPAHILRRGYAQVTELNGGMVISEGAQLSVGNEVLLTFSDGATKAKITETNFERSEK